jgi:hypothetical protein
MEPEGSLLRSQEPTTGPYPEPDSSSLLLRSIPILFSHLCLGVPSGLFPAGYPTKILFTILISPMRATCPLSHRDIPILSNII